MIVRTILAALAVAFVLSTATLAVIAVLLFVGVLP